MANILILGGGFAGGRAVFGSCPGARLEVPVYEAAFALARRLEQEERKARITVVNHDFPVEHPGGGELVSALRPALERFHVETLNDFPVTEVEAGLVRARPPSPCSSRSSRTSRRSSRSWPAPPPPPPPSPSASASNASRD